MGVQATGQSGDLEERVQRLERTVAAFSARLESLEHGAVRAPAPRAEAAAAEAPVLGGVAQHLQGVPALAGRSCLVLGGAFLVRSLTEAGTLSSGLGVALGVVYALAWLVLADRAAARGQHLSGAFHALSSALIVYPLFVEATIRFGLLTAVPAAVLLAAATALGLFVAWRRAFRTVAWITVVAAVVDGTILLFRTRAVLVFVVYLLTLGIASLVLAYGRGWRGQRWLVAIALDLVVLLLGALRLVGEAPPDWLSAWAVLVAQLGLASVYLGAFVLRLLVQAREVTPFAITQTILVLALGFEGALLVGGGPTRSGIAVAALLLGAVLHAVLARRSEQRFGHGVAVGYFSTLATFLAAESVRVLLPPTIYPALWVLAAVLLAGLALSGKRPILQVHAALLASGGAIASGLLLASFAALAFRAQTEWSGLSPVGLVVLALGLSTAVVIYRGASGEGTVAIATRTLVLGVALVGVAGLVVSLAAASFALAPGPAADAARLAVVRSAVLAVAAVLVAGWRSAGAPSEIAGLAWAILVLGGVKLLLEDLRVGRAGTLVLSLALYGTALILVPALVRRGRASKVT